MDDLHFLVGELREEFKYCKTLGIVTADLIKLRNGLQSLVAQLVGDLPLKAVHFIVDVVNTVTVYANKLSEKRKMAGNN